MEESNGFFLMHRKILHSVVFDDPITLKVWIWCLSKVSYKERDFILGGQVVHVKKGQFVTGRESASKELKIGEQVYRNRISILKKLGKITVKSTSRFSKITVVNWEYYQQSFRNTTSRQPADNQPTTTNNKENKENKLLGETSSPKNNKKDMFNKYGEDYEEGVIDLDGDGTVEDEQETKKAHERLERNRIKKNLKLIEDVRELPYTPQALNADIKVFQQLESYGWTPKVIMSEYIALCESKYWKEEKIKGKYPTLKTVEYQLRNKQPK